MAKQLQRTIIVTIVDTWTLTWADQEEQSEDGQPHAILADSAPSSIGGRTVSIAQVITVSSSHVAMILPEQLAIT
jgi:hypothetical protein